MKVISSYQKLKLRIAELEKEKYELEKAIVEDNFQVLYNVKNLWRIRADMDRSLLFGERNSGAGLTEHIRKYPTKFAEAFKVSPVTMTQGDVDDTLGDLIENTNPKTKGLFSGHRYSKVGKLQIDMLPDFLKNHSFGPMRCGEIFNSDIPSHDSPKDSHESPDDTPGK